MYCQLPDTGFLIKIKRACTYLCRVFIHTYISVRVCTHTNITCSLPRPTERQKKSCLTKRYPQVKKVINIRVTRNVTLSFRLGGCRRFERWRCLHFLRLNGPRRTDVFKWNYHPLFHSLQVRKFMREVAVVMQQHFGAKVQTAFDVKTIFAQNKNAWVFTQSDCYNRPRWIL